MTKQNIDINTTYIQPSNFVPHFWNYKIVDKEGSPDLPCIMILAELFSWYRNLPNFKPAFHSDIKLPELVDDKLAISYDFLALKLNFQKERIRRNLVKLEQLNILKREVRNISISKGGRANQLLIVFNIEFIKSCFREPSTDNRVVDTVNIIYDSADSNIDPHQSGDPLCKKNNFKKDRSIESNFISNYSKEKEDDSTSRSNNSFSLKPKTLIDFYPLKESDCLKLQSLSGRSFSLNAMNEILKDMAKRLKDTSFYSSKGFFAYMAKAFSYELRNENLVSNETFRIKANYSDEENNIITQEKFLSEIEYSRNTSYEWQFKKKLASRLERNTAYNILSNYKGFSRVGDKLKIHLRKEIEIQKSSKENILNEAGSIFNRIEQNGEFDIIKEIEFVFDKNTNRNHKKAEKNLSEKLANITDKKEIDKLPLLQKIRRYLMDYQERKIEGIGVDKAWFSKIEIEKPNSKELQLKAPNDFYKDYINNNYLYKIEAIAERLGFNFVSIETA